MSPAHDETAEQKPAEKSRRSARVRVLRTAQIYDVGAAEGVPTGDLTIAVLVGDEQCEPHLHGLRAPRERWLKIIRRLIAEDPALGEALRAA